LLYASDHIDAPPQVPATVCQNKVKNKGLKKEKLPRWEYKEA